MALKTVSYSINRYSPDGSYSGTYGTLQKQTYTSDETGKTNVSYALSTPLFYLPVTREQFTDMLRGARKNQLGGERIETKRRQTS